MTYVWQPGKNDPLARRKVGEPYFTLLARDPLAEGVTRLWGALRAQKPELASVIFKKLLEVSRKLPYSPDKQTGHVIEASNVANHMGVWLTARLANPGIDEEESAHPEPVRTTEEDDGEKAEG